LAILDTENNHVVIRLVYDGPPFSGKTTTLKALAGSLAREVYTPEEANGRTVYFDWMDYTGGLFEGYQIRCQMVSVPGQLMLADRRERLIETADVIVFVGDTARDEIDASITHLRSLARRLKKMPGPPIGVVFQANKRDHPDAVGVAEIQEMLGRSMNGIGIVESIAKDGVGVRQAFVFGVRLSLDRVRELIRTDSLERGRPRIDNGYDLLQSIKSSESSASTLQLACFSVPPQPSVYDSDGMVSEVIGEALSIEEEVSAATDFVKKIKVNGNGIINGQAFVETRATESSAPRPPDPNLPGGLIWPPVEGRMILHEASRVEITPSRNSDGDWSAGHIDSWRVHSYSEAEFDDLEKGRHRLIEWAHLHIAALSLLSPRRCLALAETGDGSWRLWQVIHTEKSLREYLCEALAEDDTARIAAGIWGTAHILLTGAEQLKESPCPLPCSLDSISWADSMVYFNGLMPPHDVVANVTSGESPDADLILRDQIGSVLSDRLKSEAVSVPDLIDRLRQRTDDSTRSQQMLAALIRILEMS